MAYMDVTKDWPMLFYQTQYEILDVIKNLNTMVCSNPETLLMCDLKFNVTSSLLLVSF
jgi:hypothetical protein